MALAATTVWEVRTTGNAANGGGFNADRDAVNGVDYTQQDSAQLAPTDLYRVAASSLYSDSFVFTAAMVGNIIKIASGTHFTAGYYEITAYVDATHVTLDSDPASEDTSAHKDGVGKVGGALNNLSVITGVVAGMKWWVKKGTYNSNGFDYSAKHGTNLLPYEVEGYDTTRGDDPTGTNRPLVEINAGYWYAYGNFWKFFNMSFWDGAGGGGWPYCPYLGNNCVARNCKFHSNDFFGYPTIQVTGPSVFIDCEFLHRTNGTAHYLVQGLAVGVKYHGCLFTGSMKGVLSCGGDTFNSCIFQGITTQAIEGNGDNVDIMNCVFYNCAKAVYVLSANYTFLVINSIIDTCTTGLECAASSPTNIYTDYNNYYNNTNDVVNVVQGPNDTAVDPSFTNSAGGDFSLAAGSGCIDAAFSTRLGVG